MRNFPASLKIGLAGAMLACVASCASSPAPGASSSAGRDDQTRQRAESEGVSVADGAFEPSEPVWRRIDQRRARRPVRSGDGFTPPHMTGATPVRVAVLLPFSAQSEGARNIASAMFDAAQLALFDVADGELLLIPKDTGGTPEGAARAAQSAIQDGAEIILGPLFASSVVAAAEPARRAGVPIIAFSSDLDVAGDGVYTLSFPPEIEIARITDYTALQGHQSFAVMAPQSDYGRKVSEAFAEEVFMRGGVVVRQESYERVAEEMFPPARRLANYNSRHRALLQARQELEGQAEIDPTAEKILNALEPLDTLGGVDFDVVLLPEEGNLLRALAPLMPYFGVDPRKVKLIGTSLWHNPDLLREPALAGGWFAAPDPALRDAFTRKYRAAYDAAPPRLASLAYDAVALAARQARRSPRLRFGEQELTDPNGFIGVDGRYRFTPDGRIERALAVLEIRPSGFRVIEPAPQTFAISAF